MTNWDDQRTVLRLAFLTADRSDAEQRAVLRVADALDVDRNKRTVTNRNWRDGRLVEPSFLHDEAQASRSLVDGHHDVELPNRKGAPRDG